MAVSIRALVCIRRCFILAVFQTGKQLSKYRVGEMQSTGKLEVKTEIKSATKFCSQKIYPIELQTYAELKAGGLAAEILTWFSHNVLPSISHLLVKSECIEIPMPKVEESKVQPLRTLYKQSNGFIVPGKWRLFGLSHHLIFFWCEIEELICFFKQNAVNSVYLGRVNNGEKWEGAE